MLSRAPLRSAFESRLFCASNPLTSTSSASSSFFANRAYLHQPTSATQFEATPPEIPPTPTPSSSTAATSPATAASTSSLSRPTPPVFSVKLPTEKPAVAPTFTEPLKLTRSLTSLLPYLTSQSSHYISAHFHARPYLITEGDSIRLPFRMPNVQPGDVLRLNRASVLGSRDFTLKGTPYVDERLFECRVRVLGTEAEPLRIKEKTKRRNRHVKRVKSKHKYTVLRVMEVKVRPLEELLAEGAEIIEG